MPSPVVLHYTFAFDVTTNAAPDSKGRFRFLGANLGEESLLTTTFPSAFPAGFSQVGPPAAGSKLFITIIETTGNFIRNGALGPKAGVVTFGNWISGFPSVTDPAAIELPRLSPLSTIFSGPLDANGFDIPDPDREIVFFSFNIAVLATPMGETEPRIFCLDAPAQLTYVRDSSVLIPLPTVASDGAADTTGVPIP